MTDILTTYVSKGGTGKTTITVNFAAMATSKGKRIKNSIMKVDVVMRRFQKRKAGRMLSKN
ncbi:ParA family protein [Priestia sp. FSL R5-0680]|uniref:ParA family protein n=1 Tax=Priestia sp. FSL R5-0680 TaxID=2921582 RepID=UPI0030F8267F